MNFSSAELEKILTERLESTRKEKSELRENVESLENKIKSLRKQLGQTPRESEGDLDAALQNLEHAHNTTAGNKGDERAFMRERDKIRQKKKALATHMKVRAELDEVRYQMTDFRKSLAEKEDAISELSAGLRKVKIANRLDCNSQDIMEKRFVFEESKISRIVGRGGNNLRSIERDCGVSFEVDSHGGGVSIMGTAATIAKAHAAVMSIVETLVEEFSLSDEIIVCLLMDKALRVNEIQKRHGVRVDVSRAKNLCKITGLTTAVEAAKAEILEMQSIRTDILIEASYLPFIIGKGGSNITSMEEHHNVAINLNRDRNTIEVTGLRPAVAAAVQQLKDMIDENKEIEESIQLERHVVLGCLIGSGGQTIRALSKQLGVRIDTSDNDNKGGDGSDKSNNHLVLIRGPASKVATAKERVMELVQSFISNSTVVDVDDEIIPIVLGRGGANIKAMREKYSDANIDIQGHSIHIQCASDEIRNAIRAEFEALIEANYSDTVQLNEDCLIQLKSVKGTEVREKIIKELQVRFSIDKNNTFIKLRGSREAVTKSIEVLDEFRRSRAVSRINVTDEDYPMFLKSGEDSVVKAFEAKYSVEISSNRKDLVFIIRGSPGNVADAEEAISGFLEGDERFGAVLINLDPLVHSALIGKQGGNIKKMEDQFGVKFDLLKHRCKLRIRAKNPALPDTEANESNSERLKVIERIRRARSEVLSFIDNTKVSDILRMEHVHLLVGQISAIIAKTHDIFQIETHLVSEHEDELNADGSHKPEQSHSVVITLKGTFALVSAGKVYLQEHLARRSCLKLPILSSHTDMMERQMYGALKRLQEKFKPLLTIQLVHATNNDKPSKGQQVSSADKMMVHNPHLEVTSDPDTMQKVKPEIYKCCAKALPAGEFATIDVDSECLRELCSSSSQLDEICFVGNEAVLAGKVCATADRDSGIVIIVGDAGAVAAAQDALMAALNEHRERHAFITIEEFMVPLIVGKGGATINGLRKSTGVSIEVNTGLLRLEIRGKTKDAVKKALEIAEKKVHQIQAEYWETRIPANCIPLLIGKHGANIKQLRTDSGANVDIDPNEGVVRVTGNEAKVTAARKLIEEFVAREEANRAVQETLIITPAAIPAVIGSKGSKIREIQTTSGAKLDIDRTSQKCQLRGSETGCRKAIEMINEVLSTEGFPPVHIVGKPSASAADNYEEEGSDHCDENEEPIANDPSRTNKILPGAPPEVLQRIAAVPQSASGKPLSKSALKRLRKKEAAQQLELQEPLAEETSKGSLPEPKPDEVAAENVESSDEQSSKTEGSDDLPAFNAPIAAVKVTKSTEKSEEISSSNGAHSVRSDDATDLEEFSDALQAPPTPVRTPRSLNASSTVQLPPGLSSPPRSDRESLSCSSVDGASGSGRSLGVIGGPCAGASTDSSGSNSSVMVNERPGIASSTTGVTSASNHLASLLLGGEAGLNQVSAHFPAPLQPPSSVSAKASNVDKHKAQNLPTPPGLAGFAPIQIKKDLGSMSMDSSDSNNPARTSAPPGLSPVGSNRQNLDNQQRNDSARLQPTSDSVKGIPSDSKANMAGYRESLPNNNFSTNPDVYLEQQHNKQQHYQYQPLEPPAQRLPQNVYQQQQSVQYQPYQYRQQQQTQMQHNHYNQNHQFYQQPNTAHQYSHHQGRMASLPTTAGVSNGCNPQLDTMWRGNSGMSNGYNFPGAGNLNKRSFNPDDNVAQLNNQPTRLNPYGSYNDMNSDGYISNGYNNNNHSYNYNRKANNDFSNQYGYDNYQGNFAQNNSQQNYGMNDNHPYANNFHGNGTSYSSNAHSQQHSHFNGSSGNNAPSYYKSKSGFSVRL